MKKRTAFLLLTLLLPLLPAAAQQRPVSFGREKLQYSIRHNLFPGTIGTMSFQGKDDGAVYRLDAVLTASVGSFYTLDCSYGSVFYQDAALTPVSATREQKEKKYWAKGLYDWSAPGKVHMDVTKSTRPHRDEWLEWPGTVRDLLGMLWWLRTLDYDKARLDIGGNALLLDHDPLPVTLSSYEKKTIKFGGQQRPVIEAVLSQGGKEVMRMTLSDDARRTPLKFSLGLSFGTIKGTLIP